MSSSNKLQLLVSFIVKSIPTVTEKSSPVSSMLSNGIKDVVKEGENGFIAERRNAKSLADCIRKLIDDPELSKKMGEDSYYKLYKYFTEEVFENSMVKRRKQNNPTVSSR